MTNQIVWEPLQDAVSLIIDHRGKTPKKLGSDFTDSGIPVASAMLVKDGILDLSNARCVSSDIFRKWMAEPLKAGDVILTSEAPLGRVALVPSNEPLVLGQRLFALRGRAGHLDSRYLYYVLQSDHVARDIQSRATGTTVFGIRQSALRQVELPILPLPEQQAIAEVLGALDDKIAANRKLVTTIDSLMIALVSELDGETTLSELAELHKTPIQPSAMPAVVSHYSLPLFDAGTLPGHEASETIKSGKFSFNHPAVLLSKLNPQFPRIWNVPSPEDNAVASTEFLVLEPRSISTATLWALLSTRRASTYLQEHVSGTTGSHQRFKPAQAMAMPMPATVPAELEETLTGLGDRAVAARYESQTLAKLRDTLLPALMDGTIRVKDAEKSAEEVL